MHFIFKIGTLSLCALAISYSSLPNASASPATSQSQSNLHSTKPTLYGSVNQSELVDSLESIGVKLIRADGGKTLLIDSVRMGSKAYYRGLCAQDLIKSFVSKDGAFTLTISRDGKVYQLEIAKSGADKTASMSAAAKVEKTAVETGVKDEKVNLTPERSSWIRPKTDLEKAQLVMDCDVELLIDRSGSMAQQDGTEGLSKWDWCYEQVQGLSGRLGRYKKTLTLTMFNSTYEVLPHLQPEMLPQVYGTFRPAGGTDLVDPLLARLNETLSSHSDRPMVIGVITDGQPNIPRNPFAVNSRLIEFTQQLDHPNQVLVVFFQIGDSFDGKAFCSDLSFNLKNEGAKYGICETVTFDELKQQGLINALAEKIFDNQLQENATLAQKNFRGSIPEKGLAAKTSESRAEASKSARAELEKKLLGR